MFVLVTLNYNSMSENPFAEKLKLALKAQSITECVSFLRDASKILVTHIDPKPFINSKTVLLLGKLSNNEDYQIVRYVGHIYTKICDIIPKTDSALLITLSNDILQLCDILSGTEVAENLQESVNGILVHLFKHGGLGAEQTQIVQRLLDKKPTIDVKAVLEPIIEEVKSNNPYGMNRLMDLLSSRESLKEQYLIFGNQLNPVINSLLGTSDRDIYVKIQKILEHMIFQTHYNIRLSTYDQSSESHLYTIVESKDYSMFENVFYAAYNFLNILKPADIFITQNLLKILIRLWYAYPQHRPSLYTLIFNNLVEIASGGISEYKAKAAKFLHIITHSSDTDSEFKGKLESEAAIEGLFKNEAYIDQEIDLLVAEDVIDFDDIQIIAGFPLSITIQPGEQKYYVIEVKEPNSILQWGFATEYYDVSYTLWRVDLPTPEVILHEEKVQCDQNPVSGIRLLKSPGLYRFSWDNSYSWFRSKHLRFRISLLKPFKHLKSEAKSRECSKIINIIHEDEVGDACFTTPTKNVLEVGVHIKNNVIVLSALENNEAFEIEEEDQIPFLIAGFIDTVCEHANQEYSIRKIGITEKQMKYREGLEDLGAVAICRDVDAIGLLSQQSLHSNTLISVVIDEGLRSCVILRGRILIGDDGVPLGDISKLKNTDPGVGIATLLCMFGPAVVVISGQDFKEDIAALSERVSYLVPMQVWQHSVIRESVYGPHVAVVAASKLHFLHYRYKFAF
ncbi:unnamed protein product [Blepharisma stoltei]|uniref:GOLD domain-containing protein n=1 Tax=Blepharisma stoltei TaxID=1481888 RepID=A0AAU9JSC0_9CILI|nr:unnamed protein product [Blepharisma stoltei]